ncbi:MAG: hypothetical protein M0Z61_13750, partial [Nitrospiraceae bacterium]|nr:hypothetical protein [Nitrospiraceae bacterium]
KRPILSVKRSSLASDVAFDFKTKKVTGFPITTSGMTAIRRSNTSQYVSPPTSNFYAEKRLSQHKLISIETV